MPSLRSSSARLARRCVGHNSHPGHTILRGAGTSAWCILRERPRRAARPRRSRCVGARQVARAVGGGARRCCSRWKCKTCPLPCTYTAPRPAARIHENSNPCWHSMVGCTRPRSAPSRARIMFTLSTIQPMSVPMSVLSPRWKPRAAGHCVLKEQHCMPTRQGIKRFWLS